MAPTRRLVGRNARRISFPTERGRREPTPLRRWPVSLDKWYVDVLSPDGGVLILYLARLHLFGLPLHRFAAELYREDGSGVQASGPLSCCEVGSPAVAAETPAPGDERLRWETPGLCGDLVYCARHEPVTLREPLLEEGTRRLLWTVEVPDADVSGMLWWPGGKARIAGRGYRDRVRFDLPPWRLPLQELRWGRAVAGAHSCTWLEAKTAKDTIDLAWIDGASATPDAARPDLFDRRLIADVAVVDIPGLRLGALRSIARRLFRDPRQERWVSRAAIGDELGWALFETVRWR